MLKKENWDDKWPEENLEYVYSCPICQADESELLLRNLVDNAFKVAPGKWNLYQCQHCKSAYLNPRPDVKSIHKAYGTYYTHEISGKEKPLSDKASLIRKLRRQLANGYYNYHHGTNRQPSTRLGAWLLLCYPKFRKQANAQFRYLEKPRPGQKLLDVGCGNGDYLVVAAEAGWKVKGVEPDHKALEVARSRGLEVVQGSLDEIAQTGELFDVITMSHVIEHVHDPVNFVKLAYQCLKPGGTLFIDTPNIESSGAKRFGMDWRGIETPRHLVILSAIGLRTVLQNIGFEHLIFFPRQEVRKNIALKSYRMSLGLSPYNGSLKKLPLNDSLRCYIPRRHDREEFLTLLARKN